MAGGYTSQETAPADLIGLFWGRGGDREACMAQLPLLLAAECHSGSEGLLVVEAETREIEGRVVIAPLPIHPEYRVEGLGAASALRGMCEANAPDAGLTSDGGPEQSLSALGQSPKLASLEQFNVTPLERGLERGLGASPGPVTE